MEGKKFDCESIVSIKCKPKINNEPDLKNKQKFSQNFFVIKLYDFKAKQRKIGFHLPSSECFFTSLFVHYEHNRGGHVE